MMSATMGTGTRGPYAYPRWCIERWEQLIPFDRQSRMVLPLLPANEVRLQGTENEQAPYHL
jgi:hypothetical protein